MRVFLICVFAIMASYLVMSMPLVFAVTVNIKSGGFTEATVEYSPGSVASVSIDVEGAPTWASPSIIMGVENIGGNTLQSVYIYKCKDKNPVDCVSSESPDTYSAVDNRSDINIPWSDIASQVDSYPQEGNLLLIAETKIGNYETLSGFWYRFERRDADFPAPYWYENTVEVLSSIDVNLNLLDYYNHVKDFISTYQMIPFNPEWVSSVVFQGASGLYEIKSDSVPNFSLSTHADNELNNITLDYSLVLGHNSVVIDPVTLFLNPLFTCGENGCEIDLGENQDNCCYDCGCVSGFYCDGSGTDRECKREGDITLGLLDPITTVVADCRVDNSIDVYVKVNNPPTDMSVLSSAYYLSGATSPEAMSCTGDGNVYTCTIVIPAVPDCDEGEYNLGPNKIEFNIAFSDGPDPRSKTLTIDYPNITVGSWTCGQYGCETDLGENQDNCCYDCGCSPGSYCDIGFSLQPSTGSCKQDLSNNNLVIADVDPSHFYTHNSASGDHVYFEARITNRPASLVVQDEQCSVDCRYNLTMECSASCSVSCSQEASESNDVYNSTCDMVFKIDSYDPLLSYSIYPELTYLILYSNGSESITTNLSSTFQTINIGAHWCGDMVCNPDENSVTCCYDCGCSPGYYCDTKDRGYPSMEDSCRPESGIAASIESIGPLSFTDTGLEHNVSLTVAVINSPSGLVPSYSCDLGGGILGCSILCRESNTSTSSVYRAECQLTIPPMDYSTSPFYNNVTKEVLISDNGVDLGLEFNNGSGAGTLDFILTLPELLVIPIPYCGNLACEGDLGENRDNCCYDCSCLGEDEFCYIGTDPDGVCMSQDEIALVIGDVYPDPINCTIFEKGGECLLSNTIELFAKVINPPPDINLEGGYYYELDGEEHRDFTCSDVLSESENYTCWIALSPIEESTPGTTELGLNLHLPVSYTLNNTHTVKNITTSTTLDINRLYSQELMTCLEQEEKMQEKIDELEMINNIIIAFFVIFIALTLGFCACCWGWICSGGGWTCTACGIGLLVITCIGSVLLMVMGSVAQQLQQLKMEKSALCTSSDLESLRGSEGGMSQIGYTIGSAVLGIICAIGIWTKGFGMLGGAAAGGPAPLFNPEGAPYIPGSEAARVA